MTVVDKHMFVEFYLVLQRIGTEIYFLSFGVFFFFFFFFFVVVVVCLLKKKKKKKKRI